MNRLPGVLGYVVVAALLWTLVCGASVVQAAEADAAAISRENRMLKAKMKLLEDANAQLKKRVRELEAALFELKEKPSKEELGEDGERVYRSFEEIFRELPKAEYPQPDLGWDKWAKEHATAWLNKHVAGNKYKARHKISRVSAGESYAFRTNRTGPRWAVSFEFERSVFRHAGVALSGGFGLSTYSPTKFVIRGDERLMRAGRNLKVGDVVEVAGVIQSVAVRPSDTGVGLLSLHLTDPAFRFDGYATPQRRD